MRTLFLTLSLFCLAQLTVALSPPQGHAQPDILFRSDPGGNVDIYGINADGTGLIQITSSPLVEQLPRWSPDRTQIAHTCGTGSTQDICLTSWPGLSTTVLVTGGGNTFPSWSADGDRVAYSSNSSGNLELLETPANSPGGGILCATSPFEDTAGHLNQFGETVFASNRDASPQFAIYILDSCGGTVTPLTVGLIYDSRAPVWSPDGQQVAFMGMTGPSASQESIYIINRDGTGLTQLPKPPGTTDMAGGGGGVDWSPSGDKLVFSARVSGNNDLYIIDLSDSSFTRLTTSSANDIQPSWGSVGPVPAIMVSGAISSDCGDPLVGVPVTLADGGSVNLSTTSSASGAYVFGGVPANESAATVSIAVPGGFLADIPSGGTAAIALDQDTIQDFSLECTFVEVSGTVGGCNGGLQGVTVDLDLDPLNPNAVLLTEVTDANGFYSFDNLRWSPDTAEVSVVIPLGYEAIDPVEGDTTLVLQSDQTLDVLLDCLTPNGNPRARVYWKRQAKVYLKNWGYAQESELDMTTNFPSAIFSSFYSNGQNPIEIDGVTYVDNGFGPEPLDLVAIHGTLRFKGNASKLAKAKAHYLALLFNIVSGKLLTSSVVSDDGATASQALQMIADYIEDGDPSNDKTARNIARRINRGRLVAAGVINLTTADIAYKRSSAGPVQLLRALKNPFFGAAQIQFRLPQDGLVNLAVFDIEGRLVRTLAHEPRSKGEYTVTWDGRNENGQTVGSGVFLLKLQAGKTESTQRITRIR